MGCQEIAPGGSAAVSSQTSGIPSYFVVALLEFDALRSGHQRKQRI
jgi:hypothetical protein